MRPSHLHAELLQAADLLRVVRQQADRLHLQRVQHVRRDAVVALVVAEAEGEVGLHGVEAVVLQAVGADLVQEADAAPFLPQVEQDAVLHLPDRLERGLAAGRGSRSAASRWRRRSGTRSAGAPARSRRRVTSPCTNATCSLPSRLFQNATTWNCRTGRAGPRWRRCGRRSSGRRTPRSRGSGSRRAISLIWKGVSAMGISSTEDTSGPGAGKGAAGRHLTGVVRPRIVDADGRRHRVRRDRDRGRGRRVAVRAPAAGAGAEVVVLDRASKVGGRCATREIDRIPFDYGPLFLHGDEPAFLGALDAVADVRRLEGWPRRIEGRRYTVPARSFCPRPAPPRVRGRAASVPALPRLGTADQAEHPGRGHRGRRRRSDGDQHRRPAVPREGPRAGPRPGADPRAPADAASRRRARGSHRDARVVLECSVPDGGRGLFAGLRAPGVGRVLSRGRRYAPRHQQRIVQAPRGSGGACWCCRGSRAGRASVSSSRANRGPRSCSTTRPAWSADGRRPPSRCTCIGGGTRDWTRRTSSPTRSSSAWELPAWALRATSSLRAAGCRPPGCRRPARCDALRGRRVANPCRRNELIGSVITHHVAVLADLCIV